MVSVSGGDAGWYGQIGKQEADMSKTYGKVKMKNPSKCSGVKVKKVWRNRMRRTGVACFSVSNVATFLKLFYHSVCSARNRPPIADKENEWRDGERRPKRWLFILVLLQELSVAACGSGPILSTRIVETRYGKLQGLIYPMDHARHLKPVEVFLGIPYATPPVRSNRFSPTRTPSPWDGIRIADKLGPVCPQKLPGESQNDHGLRRLGLEFFLGAPPRDTIKKTPGSNTASQSKLVTHSTTYSKLDFFVDLYLFAFLACLHLGVLSFLKLHINIKR